MQITPFNPITPMLKPIPRFGTTTGNSHAAMARKIVDFVYHDGPQGGSSMFSDYWYDVVRHDPAALPVFVSALVDAADTWSKRKALADFATALRSDPVQPVKVPLIEALAVFHEPQVNISLRRAIDSLVDEPLKVRLKGLLT
jgi:hypothetical protein